jgi:uncharacterized protein (DUF885 family)
MRLTAAFLVAALAAPAVPAAPASEGERFNAWLASTWEEQLRFDPVTATAIGDERYNDRLPDFSSAAYRAEGRALNARFLKELKRFDRKRLSGQDRLSYDILLRDLKLALEGERFPGWMQPLNQFGSAPSFLAQMGSGRSIQPFRNTKDYEDWLKRMAAAPAIFDGMIANMRVGIAEGVTQPKPIMEKVLPQLAALVKGSAEDSIFWGPIAAFPDAVPVADRERLTAAYREEIGQRLLPAYARLHAFVRDEYLPRCRTTTAWAALPDGKAWYAFRVKSSTTTDLSAERIHQLGLAEVARIRGEMDAVRQQVGFQGDLHAFFAHLQSDPAYFFTEPGQVLAAYREQQQRINALLPKLFDVFPKADYEVREVEAFRAQSAAGASYQAGTPDGSRAGVFYVNTFNLKAQPKWGTETLSLHEASPGHHFQVSIAQEIESLPAFRRFNGYVAYDEGWALYAESVGKELGLFTDPYQWFGRLNDEQLRAMRLVVDTGLHHKGWTREQAIAYMLDNSALAESDVVAEVERYMVIPGQALGYKVGQLEITKLRAEAERALGARFDAKAFHRVVLTDGALPMSVLATKVREWIVAERKRSS